MSSTTLNYTIQMGPQPIASYVPQGEDSDGLRKPEDVRAKVIFENLPSPTNSMSIISRGAVEESLENVWAILVDDYSEKEVKFDVTEDEEQQIRRRPRGSDAYQRELLQDNNMKLLQELSTLDEDDLSSVGSSDEESSYASDDDDLDVFFF